MTKSDGSQPDKQSDAPMPRVDAEIKRRGGTFDVTFSGDAHLLGSETMQPVVSADFARQLERELAEKERLLVEAEVFMRDHTTDKARTPLSAGERRSESGEAFLGENDYREALIEQQDYLRRLKHRADVRGGPDVSAMGIADEAIARIEELLDGHKPPSATVRLDTQLARENYEPPEGWQLKCEKCGADTTGPCGWTADCPTGLGTTKNAADSCIEPSHNTATKRG